MAIPPVSSQYAPGGKQPDPLVQQFYTDWSAWYATPNETTGTTLLNFLTDNKAQIFAMGSKLPCPFPPPYSANFEQCYQTACDNLERWITNPSDPCDPTKTTGVSEWIADLYDWLRQ